MSQTLLAPNGLEILDALPDAVMWVRPVRNSYFQIVDFEVAFCNQKANDAINHPGGSINGMQIKRDGIPAIGALAEINFNHFLNVYADDRAADHSFYAPLSGKYFEMSRRKFKDGVLSVTRDRTAQRTAERKEKEHTELLYKIIQNAPAGIATYEAVRNDSKEIVDFRCKLFNEELNRLTGFSDEERKTLTLKQILSDTDAGENFSQYSNTVETGNPFSLSFFYEKTKKWLEFFGTQFGDGFISILTDNTEKIQHEHELKRHSQYLDSILNASQNAINTMQAILNEKGEVVNFRYMQINNAFEKLTQMRREEVVGRTVLDFFPNTVPTGIFAAACNTLNSGIPFRTQVHYQRAHLSTWLDLSIVKLDDDTLVGTFSDISEIKAAEFQLEVSHDRLSRFINAAQTGLGLFQPVCAEDGTVIDFTYGITNTSFANYSGRTPQELLGLKVSEIFPTYKRNGNFEIFKQTYESGKSIRFESHFHGDGLDAWFDTIAIKMAEGVLVNVNDISEVKKLHLKLERYVEELKRSNANLEAFAYAASHDMKEPIRKITFFSDFIKNDKESKFSQESKKMFDRLLAASDRMATLIEDLLSYAQISLQTVPLQSVDLNDIVRAALMDLEMLMEEKEAVVNIDPLPVVEGQPRQLQQLFLNLLGNALKYTRKGVTPVITITNTDVLGKNVDSPYVIDQTIQYHFLQVADNGIGFHQEDAERIFHVFQRLHGNNEYSGTGIGLAIVRKVVETHRGYIWAEGKVDVGSRFNILLPRQIAGVNSSQEP